LHTPVDRIGDNISETIGIVALTVSARLAVTPSMAALRRRKTGPQLPPPRAFLG